MNELGAVAPDAVDGVGEGDAGGIALVPGIFGAARLLRGGLGCERRQRWAGHRPTPTCSGSSVLAPKHSESRWAPGRVLRHPPKKIAHDTLVGDRRIADCDRGHLRV